jgi:cytochrome c-type biogenesis protein CcmH
MRVRIVLAALLLAILGFGLAPAPAHADPKDPTLDRPLADPTMEARARAFMREIRCVVCQSQSIDESDAEIAAQLRNVVREQFAAGKSEEEIRDFLVARYGDFVLLHPPLKSTTVILWFGPFVLAGLGFAGAYGMLRRSRAAGSAAGPAADTTPPALSDQERRRLAELLAGGPERQP